MTSICIVSYKTYKKPRVVNLFIQQLFIEYLLCAGIGTGDTVVNNQKKVLLFMVFMFWQADR